MSLDDLIIITCLFGKPTSFFKKVFILHTLVHVFRLFSGMSCQFCFEVRSKLLYLEHQKNEIQCMQNEADVKLEHCIEVNVSYVIMYLINTHILLLAEKLNSVQDKLDYFNIVLREHITQHNQ